MNPSSAPTRFFRYVESRRIHLPKVLSEHALQLQYESINLGDIQTRWKKQVKDEHFWLKHQMVGVKPIFARWFLDFDDTMVAQVRVVSDPADVYSIESDVTSKRLLITFNEASVKEIDGRLNNDIKLYKTGGTQPEALWELRSLTLSIGYNSPFGNILSVFRPSDKIDVQDIQDETNKLALLIEELWPLFFIILTDLVTYASREEKDGLFHKAKEEEVWSDLYYPFHIPPTIQRMGRPEFDPSWEYSYTLCVFLSDTQERMTSWKKDLNVPLTPIGNPRGEVISAGWAMTVWELPNPLPDSELLDRALRLGLHSDTFKLVSYFNKLASTILEAIHLQSADFSPDELRRAVYQYHALKHRFSERKRWLNEMEVRHFRIMNELNKVEDDLTSAQYLGDLVIKAAEGLETKTEQRTERKIQFIAIFFTVLTLTALGMDGYNFVVGSANEPAATSLDRWQFVTRLALVLSAVIVLVLLALGAIPSWLRRRR